MGGGAQSFWTRHPTVRTSRASRQRQWRLNVCEDWALLCKLPRTTHNNNSSKSTTPTVSRGRLSTAGRIPSLTSQLSDQRINMWLWDGGSNGHQARLGHEQQRDMNCSCQLMFLELKNCFEMMCFLMNYEFAFCTNDNKCII